MPRYEGWFFDMLTHADYDEYWKNVGYNLEEYIAEYPDIPVFLETSWYGHHITATLTKYAELKARHRTPKKLLVGTWIHSPDTFGQTFAGDVDFGADAALESLNDLRSRWCDQHLKGMKTGIDERLPFHPLNIAVLTISDTRTLVTDTSGGTVSTTIESDTTFDRPPE